ncbi:MAG: PQQ-binding-like beta-propeller repeat protein [Dehalococcoidia bacterium]|nr:PQQ-binding-like beta-propeller repeat protein [Dehalococcoidia bacterium]
MHSKLRTPGMLSALVILLLVLLIVPAALGCSAAPSRGWSGLLISDNVLYVGTYQGKIVALDLTTADPARGLPPELKWDPKDVVGSVSPGFTCGRVNNPMALYGVPAVADGRLYIGTYDGTVLWVSLDGSAVSDPRFDTGKAIVGSVAIADDTLFVGSSNGLLYAIDLNLNEKWQFETGGEIYGTPVVKDGVVYIASADRCLYAVDAESGKEIWRFQTKAAIMSTPLVEYGRVYIGGCDDRFYAIRAATEEERVAAANGADPLVRQYESVFEGAKNWFWTQALAYNGQIWVGNLDHRVYVLDAEDVAQQLHEPYKTGGMVSSPPVELNGTIVVASQDGKLYAIDPESWDMSVYAIDAKTNEVFEGEAKPKNGLPPILAPMFADPASGILYLHAQDGTHTLYAFQLSTKEVLWTFRTDKIK